MRILTRRDFLKSGAAIASAITAGLQPLPVLFAAPTKSNSHSDFSSIDLRGYGKVRASTTPFRSEFICENARKADILLGKLLADMFWDAGQRHQEQTVALGPGGTKVVVHLYPPYGAMIAVRYGNQVLVLGGGDEREVLARAKKEKLLKLAGARFKPSKPYPKYLDFYDLKAITCYTMGMHPENQYRYKERFDFVKKFFPGGMVYSTSAFSFMPAEGVFPGYALLDTDLKLAVKADMAYSNSLSTGAWPDWARNKWPEDADQSSSMSLAYSGVFGGAPSESFGMTSEQRRQTSLKFLKDVMLRYKDNPSMGGWQLYCGDYFYESYFFRGTQQGHFGYSTVGIDRFHRWLLEVRGYSLDDLGRRWYGDAEHFKTWSDVLLPDPFEFFGGLDSNSFRIQDNWFWKKADANNAALPPADSPGWTPVEMPPSNMQLTLPMVPAFWRTTFDCGQWLTAHPGKEIHLVCNINNPGWKQYEIQLNGKTLGTFGSTLNPFDGPVAVNVSSLLADGINNLMLSAPGGTIAGPVFLTAGKPQAYPYLGKQENARYVDMFEWRLHELNFKVGDAAEYARSMDSDKPFVIPATTFNVEDYQGDVLTRFGGSMQNTGYEANYGPLYSRLGYAGGFYGSGEPSGLPTSGTALQPDVKDWTTTLSRAINWVLFNGEGAFIYWRDPYCYYAIEKESGWFTKNMRHNQLAGKMLPEKPGIAILFSSHSTLLDPFSNYSMWDWDIGRGELAAAHYDNVYVTETMLAKGMADDYPVLFDTNTRIMGPELIKYIHKYVENGGTFIALQETGRHDILDADTWPISELSGFKVVSLGKNGKIRFENNLPIFKGWEGKEFEGEGSALDWKDNQVAKGVSVGLKPANDNAVALARWEDGGIAVGMRTLGKGRIIVLASTFWRYGRDLGGWKLENGLESAFFERLFTDLGVRRTAKSSDKNVYARKMITKNGLQEWLVVLNQVNTTTTVDAGFACATRPAEVRDMMTDEPVAFEYADGWVTLKSISMGALGQSTGLRIFAVTRGTMSEGVDFWWGEKTKFWRRVEAVPPLVEKTRTVSSNPATIETPVWKFIADKDNSIASNNQWLEPSFNDGGWRNIGYEAWNFKFADLKDYSGFGLYRSKPFDLPTAWKGGKIGLNADGYCRWMGFCFRSAEFFVNGKKMENFPNPYRRIDITDNLKKSGNVICVKLLGRDPSGDFPLSGLLDCIVWMEPEIKLQNVISLAGDWQAVQAGWNTSRNVTLPGNAKGHHFVKEVDIPSAWQGKSVYLHLRNSPDTHAPSCGMENGAILVNGEPLNVFWFIHKAYALDDSINLTPYLKFGDKNRIELWPQSQDKDPGKEYILEMDTIEIGCERK